MSPPDGGSSREGGEWRRPLPQLDPVSTGFWEAASRGELLIQRCPSCGNRQFYPRALCTGCGGDPEWERASGRGTVHTFTVIRQYQAPPFSEELPYVVAMIDLDEGVRMMGNIIDCPVEQVSIGSAVEVCFEAAGDGVGVPMWRLATA